MCLSAKLIFTLRKMKLKSELYVQELMIMLAGINLQVKECSNVLKRERIKAHVASVLMPWQSKQIWMTLAIKADILMQYCSAMSDLKDKIMQSEGATLDMKPITLEEILQQKN